MPSNRYLSPVEIRAALENIRQMLVDLDLYAGAFTHSAATSRFWNGFNAFANTAPVAGLWIVWGKALQSRRFRYGYGFMTDVDWVLQIYLEDRFVVVDGGSSRLTAIR